MGQIEIHHPEFGFVYLFSEDFSKNPSVFQGFFRAKKLSDVHIQRTIKASGPGRLANRDDVTDGTQEPYPAFGNPAFGKPSENGYLTWLKCTVQYSNIPSHHLLQVL